jgi:hypothetical protein
MPGLLSSPRFQARFHAAAAGYDKLKAVLGWSPRLSMAECLAADI